MAERGLVFWHDKGRSRLLSEYLESLAKHIPMHRVLGTMPAWTCCGFAQASLKAKAMVFELIGIATSLAGVTYVPAILLHAWEVARLRRTTRGRLLLTYDDGPSPISPTPQILNVLRRHQARATFFLLGLQVQNGSALCDQLVAEGHEIGAHGYRHVHAWKNPFRAVSDLVQGLRTVARWRQGPPIYRQPYGKSTLWTILAAAYSGARAVWWTVDSGDSWSKIPDCHSIVRRIDQEGGGVVLMHDFPREVTSGGVQFTLALTEQLLQLAARRGWVVCTVSDLHGQTPSPLCPGLRMPEKKTSMRSKVLQLIFKCH